MDYFERAGSLVSQSGMGRFLERKKVGLKSLDW